MVDITADAAASGRFFDTWAGDNANIADVNDPSTTITMPAADAEVTATYTYVASGLVSRYTFDMDARDTYGANDGTFANGASVTSDDTRGNVATLDGTDDYVDLPEDEMAAGRSEVTLSMWIYPDEWDSTNTIYDEDQNNWWLFARTTGTPGTPPPARQVAVTTT